MSELLRLILGPDLVAAAIAALIDAAGRVPVRRAYGPDTACSLWLLPPLTAVAYVLLRRADMADAPAPFSHETLILAAFITLLRLVFSPTASVFLSAIGWGIAHSTQASAWGLVVWWPFLIMSMLYVVWRQRSFWNAIAVPAAVHMLQNAGPAYQIAYSA